MKIILTITLSFIALTLIAQDKLYTKGLPNGYAWIAPLSASHPVYGKEESILASIQDRLYTQKFDSSKNKTRFPLGCEDYINSLISKGFTDSLKIKEISKEINKFYENKDNLVIPVLGAYCYCLQKITSTSPLNIESYRKQLLDYSINSER